MKIKLENLISYIMLLVLFFLILFLDIDSKEKLICMIIGIYFIVSLIIIIQIEKKISIYGYFFIWSMFWTTIGYIRIFLINYEVKNFILIKSILLIMVCYSFMTIFYIIFIKSKKKYRIINQIRGAKLKIAYIYIFIGYISSIVIRIISLGGVNNFIKMDYVSRNFNGSLKLFPVLSFLFIIPLFCISIILLFEDQNQISKKLVAIVVIIIVTGVIIEGNRGIFMTVIPSMYYFYRKRVDNNKKWGKILIMLILSAILIVPSFLALERFRTKENLNTGIDIKEKITYLLQGRNFDTIENYIEVMNMYDKNNKLYGKTLIAPFVNFIPRSIWNNKPIGLGQKYVLDSPRFNNEGGFGIYIVGEFYANFGVVGVIVLPVIISFILCNLENIFSKAKNLIIKYYIIILTIYMTDIIRGDFLTGFTRFIYFYIFYLIFMVPVYRLRLKKKVKHEYKSVY